MQNKPYLHRYRDRHGKERINFRRGGFSVALSLTSEEEFEQSYAQAALAYDRKPVVARSPKRGQQKTLSPERFAGVVANMVKYARRRSTVKMRDMLVDEQWVQNKLAEQRYRCALTYVQFCP